MRKTKWIGTVRRGVKIEEYIPNSVNACNSIVKGHCIECGKEVTGKRFNFVKLSTGNYCGCSSNVVFHGMSNTRIYSIYAAIKDRTVLNTNNKAFIRDYINRGIDLCEEWQGRNGFLNFYNWSISHGYQENLSIDRIDNDKGYSPDNCRWTDQHTQNCNRRNTLKATINGETKAIADWCIDLGVDYDLVYGRIRKGWEPERALLEPKHERYSHPLVK